MTRCLSEQPPTLLTHTHRRCCTLLLKQSLIVLVCVFRAVPLLGGGASLSLSQNGRCACFVAPSFLAQPRTPGVRVEAGSLAQLGRRTDAPVRGGQVTTAVQQVSCKEDDNTRCALKARDWVRRREPATNPGALSLGSNPSLASSLLPCRNFPP